MPFGATIAMCKVVLKSLTSPNQPSNAGTTVPLEVRAEPGNLFHAVYPAPTFTLWTGIVALELIYKALAVGMPDRLPASSGGDVPGFMMVGIHPDTGEFFAFSNNEVVGWGAAPDHDGIDATIHLSESIVRNTPIEVMEARTRDALRAARDPRRLRRRRAPPRRLRRLRRDIVFTCDGEFLSVMKKTKSPTVGTRRRPLPGTEHRDRLPRHRPRTHDQHRTHHRAHRRPHPPAHRRRRRPRRPAERDHDAIRHDLDRGLHHPHRRPRDDYGYDIERNATATAATVEVVRSYLVAAAEEMRATLIRTAFNPVIYEVLDFGISIYDDRLRLLAEAPGLTRFLGANDYSLRKGVEYVGVVSCIAVMSCC